MNFEPPVIDYVEDNYLLDVGVKGYAREKAGEIHIEFIQAEIEGNGDVGRFLDHLSPRCVIVNVVSSRLAGMLKRRGWVQTWWDSRKLIDEWRRPC